jgi:hypothetical protein
MIVMLAPEEALPEDAEDEPDIDPDPLAPVAPESGAPDPASPVESLPGPTTAGAPVAPVLGLVIRVVWPSEA